MCLVSIWQLIRPLLGAQLRQVYGGTGVLSVPGLVQVAPSTNPEQVPLENVLVRISTSPTKEPPVALCPSKLSTGKKVVIT